MNEVAARLVVKQGPHPHEEYLLAHTESTIGRTHTNDIEIPDPAVSRQHAQITWREGQFFLEDLGSTNGTFVNDQRVVGIVALNNGDLINLGEAVYMQLLIPAANDPVDYSETATPDSMEFVVPEPASTGLAENVELLDAPPKTSTSRRRWILGCGCAILLLIFVCAAMLFFLDAYDQGRLLYCGPLRNFFEIVLGPFGFSPACAMP